MEERAQQPGALEGVRVVDLSSQLAGPTIAMYLGDLGADVVKVEHPNGDDMRRWGPSRDGVPLWWKSISRNKRLISLDLHEERDRETLRDLAAWADVIVENFRPGRLESWELGYDALSQINSRLIMVRVTGFGQSGPLHQQPGFGTLAEAFSGFASISGESGGEPRLPAFGLADGVAGMVGTVAVLAALRWRDMKSGEGQMVDLSLYEPLFTLLGPVVVEYQQLGVLPARNGNRSARTAPRNAYRTADNKWVVLSAGTQQIANRVFSAIDRPELADDPRFSTGPARRENADEIDRIVADWILTHDQDEVLDRFRHFQAAIAPVMSIPEIMDDEQYRTHGSILIADDPDLGDFRTQASPLHLSKTPTSVRWTGRSALDADREEILDMVKAATATTEATASER